MSSKRGRKRNDNLPPNRARDVQRAFRARRAAHLQALEQRVSELEEENTCLRQALNLPPANRPPLGKGPTGKDKPKTYDEGGSHALAFHSSRGSSSAESPASTRNSSLSPSAITTSMPSRSMQVIEGGSWDQSLLLSDQPSVQGSSEPSYQLSSMSSPGSSKGLQYSYANDSSVPSSTRSSSLQNNIYISNYSQSTDRQMGNNYGNQAFVMRGDMRDDPREHYSYPQSSYQSHDPNMHPQSPSPSAPSLHPHPPPIGRQSSLPYPHRRSLTEPQSFAVGQGYTHLPNSTHLEGSARQPDLPRVQENLSHAHPSHRHTYASDGRINSLS